MKDIKLPDGYEFVGYGLPEPGDLYVTCKGVTRCTAEFFGESFRIVVREKRNCLTRLARGWIAKDLRGTWFWFSDQPVRVSRAWIGSNPVNLGMLYMIYPSVEFPNCNWRYSLTKVGDQDGLH